MLGIQNLCSQELTVQSGDMSFGVLSSSNILGAYDLYPGYVSERQVDACDLTERLIFLHLGTLGAQVAPPHSSADALKSPLASKLVH